MLLSGMNLFVHTNYSFNIAASSPEEIVKQAEKLNYSSVGICDYDGVYGIIKLIELRKSKFQYKDNFGASYIYL